MAFPTQPDLPRFPPDFLWGVATSSHQIEGAVHADGRGESIWDRFAREPGAILDGSSAEVACDHYHRYREDVALMQSLGVRGYRLSVAWPRLLPEGRGRVEPAGVAFYDRLVDSLLEAGIQPFVTLYHWDLPQALQDEGGWGARATVAAFVEYAELVVRRLGDRVHHWMTHNEPWCVAFLGHFKGIHAPGLQDLPLTLQVAHHLLLSHGQAVAAIRAISPTAQVGIAPNMVPAFATSSREADLAAARRFDGYFNRWFLDPLVGRGYPEDMWQFYGPAVPKVQPGDMDEIARPVDFVGVNYYNRAVVRDAPGQGAAWTHNIAEGEIYPEGLYDVLTRLHQDYGFPALYITENGLAQEVETVVDETVADVRRLTFYDAHLRQAARALVAGAPLRGYFAWSFMDNWEWALGYTKRFGLVHVDYATLQRTLKMSGQWYRELIARHTTSNLLQEKP